MSKVFITQLLCPTRHAIIGAAWEEGHETAEGVVEKLETFKRESKLNPWCAICGSRDLQYETGATLFKDMEEAAPYLAALIVENRLANQILGRFHGHNVN